VTELCPLDRASPPLLPWHPPSARLRCLRHASTVSLVAGHAEAKAELPCDRRINPNLTNRPYDVGITL
jgi:hypothetical protein